jgi:hypothetical protein
LLKYIFAVKSIIYKFKTFTQNMIASWKKPMYKMIMPRKLHYIHSDTSWNG